MENISFVDNKIIIEAVKDSIITSELNLNQIIDLRNNWGKTLENLADQKVHALEQFGYYDNLYDQAVQAGCNTREQELDEKRIAAEAEEAQRQLEEAEAIEALENLKLDDTNL